MGLPVLLFWEYVRRCLMFEVGDSDAPVTAAELAEVNAGAVCEPLDLDP